MKTKLLSLALLASWVCCSAMVLEAQTAESDATTPTAASNPWTVDVVPYLWLASYDGTFGLPSIPTGIPPTHTESSSPFSTHISAAAMLTAQVCYHDVGLFLDGAWLQLKTEGNSGSPLYSGTELKSDIAYGTAALTYRLPQFDKLRTDVFAGARVWYIANTIEFTPGLAPGFTADSSQTWCDPIIGAILRYDLSRHWFGTVVGDVGGFGVGSDITWSVFGGVGYRFTQWFSATLGYRYLHVDYDKNDFIMNANVQGFILGLGFHF